MDSLCHNSVTGVMLRLFADNMDRQYTLAGKANILDIRNKFASYCWDPFSLDVDDLHLQIMLETCLQHTYTR